MHGHPEGAQGILDEKLDHVRFRIELGDRDDVPFFDLRALDAADFFKHPVFSSYSSID